MDYKITKFELPSDYEGQVVATLISATEPHNRQAVLYIHGYIDYFFQDNLAQAFLDHGYNFYALDLRKYGRSMLPEQHPNYCRSLSEYFPEITEALRTIHESGTSDIVMLGHSTGGLIAALYVAHGEKRELVKRLILNSPFLEFNTGLLKRKLLIPMVKPLGKIWPYAYKKNELSPLYGRSLHLDFRGRWNFDTTLKPIDGIPLYFAWLGAIRKGHQAIKRGLGITIPILTLTSAESSNPKTWNDKVFSTDIVLNIKHIQKYAKRLGPDVTIATIPGGIHDLFLSLGHAEQLAYKTMFKWLKTHRQG